MPTIILNNDSVHSCPFCDSIKIIRYGLYRSTQRYQCKNCQKTFIPSTGKPIHGIHNKQKALQYLDVLCKALSVRKAALYIGISKNTSFAWRHKFLSSLGNSPLLQIKTEKANACSITLNYSSKGRRRTPEKHKNATKTIILGEADQLMMQKLQDEKPARHLSQVLYEKTKGRIIISKPDRLMKSATRMRALRIKQPHTPAEHKSCKELEMKVFHLLLWMKRFRGVASKYLQQYWNWYINLHNTSWVKTEKQMFKTICQSRRSLAQYRLLRDV